MAYFKAQKHTHNALSFSFSRVAKAEKWIFQRLSTETLLIFEQRNAQLAGILKLQIIYPLSLFLFPSAEHSTKRLIFIFCYFHLIVFKCFFRFSLL